MLFHPQPGDSAFMVAVAILFFGMGVLAYARRLRTRNSPKQAAARYTGMMVMAAAFIALGAAFVVHSLTVPVERGFSLCFFGFALWLGIDTVSKAKAEYRLRR